MGYLLLLCPLVLHLESIGIVPYPKAPRFFVGVVSQVLDHHRMITIPVGAILLVSHSLIPTVCKVLLLGGQVPQQKASCTQ